MSPLHTYKLIRPLFALILVVLLIGMPSIATAAPPNPVPGSADVDGEVAEWDTTNDFFADMYRAANPDMVVQSKLYLRYECSTQTLYALVMALEPFTIVSQGTDAFIKLGNSNTLVNGNSGDDGTAPDFQWVGLDGDSALGWEASAILAPGNYTNLNVHTNVWDENHTSQTSAVAGRSIELNLNCSPTAVTVAGFEVAEPPHMGLLLMAGLALGTVTYVVVRRRGTLR
jgi:hypothetical protein